MPHIRCRVRLALLCAVLLLMRAPPLLAQIIPSVRVTAFGEYVAGHEAGELDHRSGPNAPAAVNLVENVQFVNQTSRIEAKLCRRFGIQFRATNLDPVRTTDVTIRVIHPPMTRPDGQSTETDAWQIAMNGSRLGLAGFAFDNPWEAVPGAWTFAVMFGNTVLAEQRFDVVAAPAEAPSPQCDDPTS